ncbi:hypothetical protein cyc_04621 [Cyclospora cayetanensis]|nr:hypothetical protein cyc_04621 [Cyclospora cayetanensis]
MHFSSCALSSLCLSSPRSACSSCFRPQGPPFITGLAVPFLRSGARSSSSLASVLGGPLPGWALPVLAATYGIVAQHRWGKQQQLFVDSGACAAATDMLGCGSGGTDSQNETPLRSKIHESKGVSTEYVLISNPGSCFDVERVGGGDTLLFFHGGLCGSDQLLASGLQFSPNIQHLLLPNRQGYLRSGVPPLWEERDLQAPFKRIRRGRPGGGHKETGSSSRATEWVRLRRHRLWHQAALFNDLVRSVLYQQQPTTPLIADAKDPEREGRLHVLGVGIGCAHALAYCHFFPQRVRSIALASPVMELKDGLEEGPLEAHVVGRIRAYRQLLERLPFGSFRLRVPPPKISCLEWAATLVARRAPRTALSVLLHALSLRRPLSEQDAEQLLCALQQYPSLVDRLQQESFGGQGVPASRRAASSWRMQQQEAWEAQQQLYKQLLLRVQHATGTCCVPQRLPGFIEDALLLSPWEEAAEPGTTGAGWLSECLEGLQVPGLVVYAGQPPGGPHVGVLSDSGASWPRLEAVNLPDAQPQTLLLTHAEQLSRLLQGLHARSVCAAAAPPVD